MEVEQRTGAGGRLFYARGPATANEPSSIDARPSTLSVVDDVRCCRQTLSGPTSIPVLFRLGSRTPAHTACTGYVVGCGTRCQCSPSEAGHMVVSAAICRESSSGWSLNQGRHVARIVSLEAALVFSGQTYFEYYYILL